MKSKTTWILVAISLVALLVMSVAPAIAAGPSSLSATGSSPREERVTLAMPVGTTLGDIQSISWDEYLVNGYPPHVDVFVDTDGDGTSDDAIVFEYAYNSASHAAETHTATEAYGALTGAWYATFSDDSNGPAAITDTSFAWLNSGAPGPYPPDGSGTGFIGGTLADWKAGTVAGGAQIDAATVVLRMEFEVDSWIKDTTALIDNIVVDLDGSSVSMNVNITNPDPHQDIVAISVDTNTINFGDLLPGATGSDSLTVTNIGTVSVDVVTSVSPSTGTVFNDGNLTITPSTFTLATPSAQQAVDLSLTVPSGYISRGAESASLVFSVTPS